MLCVSATPLSQMVQDVRDLMQHGYRHIFITLLGNSGIPFYADVSPISDYTLVTFWKIRVALKLYLNFIAEDGSFEFA